MDITQSKELAGALREELAEKQSQIKLIEAAIGGVQLLCPHDWSCTGEGYHGSSAGNQYFECKACGLQETR